MGSSSNGAVTTDGNRVKHRGSSQSLLHSTDLHMIVQWISASGTSGTGTVDLVKAFCTVLNSMAIHPVYGTLQTWYSIFGRALHSWYSMYICIYMYTLYICRTYYVQYSWYGMESSADCLSLPHRIELLHPAQ